MVSINALELFLASVLLRVCWSNIIINHKSVYFNTVCDVIWQMRSSKSVQVMVCCLLSARPLPKLLLSIGSSVTNINVFWIIKIFYSNKMHFLRPQYDDVIKWKHFPRYWPFVQGIHQSLVNSPHKSQWHGALMSSLICAWINGWVNNREAGDLRHHHTHYDVIVMGVKGLASQAVTISHNVDQLHLHRWLNSVKMVNFRGNIIYLHWAGAVPVIEIIPHERPEPLGPTYSQVPWLLMDWQCQKPGHQQSLCWLSSPGIFWFQH